MLFQLITTIENVCGKRSPGRASITLESQLLGINQAEK